jgi:hypothetical protein
MNNTGQICTLDTSYCKQIGIELSRKITKTQSFKRALPLQASLQRGASPLLVFPLKWRNAKVVFLSNREILVKWFK